MRRLNMIATALFVAATLTACSGNDAAPSPTPTPTPTPTPPTGPAVTTVVVTSSQTSPTSYQLKADARLTDGNSRDVTSTAQWQSSDPAIAQVSPTGVMTAVGTGHVDVRATYENVTGSMGFAVIMPPTANKFSLMGYVSEAPPVSKLFQGIKITITSGPDAGQFTYSNEMGFFQFFHLTAGVVTLAVDHAGYQPWGQTIRLDEDVNWPIVLYPIPPVDGSGATATARCNDASWSWAKTLETACTAQGGVAYPVCPGVLCNR